MTTLSPLTPEEFTAWLEISIPNYARDKVRSGEWTEAESLEKSRAEIAETLPQGLKTPLHHLFAIRDATEVESIGTLWIAEHQRGAHRIAYVYDFVVKPGFRRRGHAKRTFLALEGKARELGLAGVSLHVFGHNEAALALYESLDYSATNIMMFKDVAASA